MLNALTVDLEDWFHTNDFNIKMDSWSVYEDRIIQNTRNLLDLFSKYNLRATFFILGHIAQKHPSLVKEIVSRNHEIGTHGNYHRLLNTLKNNEIRQDILDSKRILEDLSGLPVLFHRAPSWSISKNNIWVLEYLEELGFVCDSSIQPFITPLSGFNGAPLPPFHPIIHGRKLKLIEFPSTILKLAKLPIPFLGGFYLRAMPAKFSALALKTVNKDRQGMLYLHPWEFDVSQPRLKAKPHLQFVHYFNIHTTQNKVETLLQQFKFGTLGETINDRQYPSIEI